MPSDMKAFNKKIIEEHRANKGELSGPMAGRKLMLLTTTGVKSGEERTVVLGWGKDGDRYLVIGSNNGAPTEPFWYRNLSVNPNVTVELGGDKFKARARTARPDERDRLKGLVSFFEGEQKKTSRQIPVVVLEPEA